MKTTTIERKIGRNRGKARLWIEGAALADAGWKKGDAFSAEFFLDKLVYRKPGEENRKVAGTADRPIIDTNTDRLLEIGVEIGEKVSIEITPEKIEIRSQKGGSK